MADDDASTFTRKKAHEEENVIYLLTLSDMSLLLLACFVLLFSMSTPNEKKFQDSMASVQKALGETGKRGAPASPKEKEVSALMDQAALLKQIQAMQQRVFNDLQNTVTKEGLTGEVGTSFEGGVVTLRVGSRGLFAGDGTELTAEGKKTLARLKDMFIKYKDQRINIRSYMDEASAKSGRRDGWETTSLRAVAVLRYLMELGLEPNRLSATGLNDLDPLVPSTSDTNRQKNNRVEFLLERTFK